MPTFPDTPDIAAALSQSDPAQAAARTRLLLLHQLGGTQASAEAGLRARIAELEAELLARPFQYQVDDLETRVAELEARVAELETPPAKPYTVPIGVFRGKLIPLRLALMAAPDAVKAVWAVLLPELDHLTEVYPREEPVAGLLALAQDHGLLTAARLADRRGEPL